MLLCSAVSIASAAPGMPDGGMAGMSGHMYMTTIKPLQAGDRQKADVVVASAKAAMAPYADYHKALSDGYEIFLPDVPQSQYHFTKYEYADRQDCTSTRKSRPRCSTRRRRTVATNSSARCIPIGSMRRRMS